jgi:hypothetical protein
MSQVRAHPEALYFHIARRAIDGIEQEKDEFVLAQRVATVIVFSALTLEAFINQEFALHPETKKLIDDEKGITLPAKWLLLPLLLQSSKTFDRGGAPFQQFAKLVKIRNAIVHFEPGRAFQRNPNPDPAKMFFGDLVKNVSLAQSCFRVIDEMIRKLHELTAGKTEMPKFLSGNEYLLSISVEHTVAIELLGAEDDGNT